MTEFTWIDRNGVRHSLNSPAPIEAEIKHVKDGLNKSLAQIETANRDEFVKLDREARAAVARLKELSDDAANWNRHVTNHDDAVHTSLLKGISEFWKNNGLPLAVAYLNKERAALAELSERDPNAAKDLLTGKLTKDQEAALKYAETQPPNMDELTCAEAYKLIDSDPKLYRPPETGSGWFEWTSLEGERCQLSSSLEIELEIMRVLDNVSDLACDLCDELAGPDKHKKIVEACDGFKKLKRLADDLSRFNDEALARSKSEWADYRRKLKQANDRG